MPGPPPGWRPKRKWASWEIPLGIALGAAMGLLPLLLIFGSRLPGAGLAGQFFPFLFLGYIGLVLGVAGYKRRFGVMVGFAIGVPVALLVFFVSCFALLTTI